MIAEIKVSGIKVNARIGVSEEERSQPQELVIDAVFTNDISKAARSGDISETVDYTQVAEIVSAAASSGEYKLLETLAHKICRQMLAISKIKTVRLKIVKRPEALKGVAENVSLQLGPLSKSDI